MPRRKAALRGACLALLLFPGGVVAACNDESAGRDKGATVEDVASGDVRLDEEVTISGEVTDITSPNLFWIGGEDVGGQALAVISAQRADVDEHDVVRVAGTVKAVGDTDRFQDNFGLPWDPAYQELVQTSVEFALKATEVAKLDER